MPTARPFSLLLRVLAVVLLGASVTAVGVALSAEREKPTYGIDHSKTIADYEKETGLSKADIVRHFTIVLNRSKTMLRDSHFLGIETWQNPFDV
jgi:hypothetical protein